MVVGLWLASTVFALHWVMGIRWHRTAEARRGQRER
jgi:hypothetical protein